MTKYRVKRSVSASELAGNVSGVLDEVQSGVTVVVTRRGEQVAVMEPADPAGSASAVAETTPAGERYAVDEGQRMPLVPAALTRLIGTESLRSVLAVFLRDPSTAFYQREVARRAGVGLRSAQIALGRLEDLGLVSSERSGNRRYYHAWRTERFEELRSLMGRDLGVVEVIRRHLEASGVGITWAFVYGSVASGTDKADSDIDLFVVGSATDDALVEPIAEAQRELGRQIDLVNYADEAFRVKRTEGNHFVTAVLEQPRIDVIGGADDA